MNASVANARIFYTLTFDPPLAQHPDEYHALQIELRPPMVTADTSAGYYGRQHATAAVHGDNIFEEVHPGGILSGRDAG
jgi:hypothetical protein